MQRIPKRQAFQFTDRIELVFLALLYETRKAEAALEAQLLDHTVMLRFVMEIAEVVSVQGNVEQCSGFPDHFHVKYKTCPAMWVCFPTIGVTKMHTGRKVTIQVTEKLKLIEHVKPTML